MADNSTPRPTTELFPESLDLSPKQRQVLNALQEFPEGARAAELAAWLGMHVNTARGHLDELVERQAARVVTAPAVGRGRPSLIFRARVPDNRQIANEYASLIGVLANVIAESETSSAAARQTAREVGSRWARQTHRLRSDDFNTAVDALTPLYRLLREMGFDPALHDNPAEDRAQVALHSCPFITATGDRPAPFVCAVHEGFVRESLSKTQVHGGKLDVSLRPFDAPGVCTVHVGHTQAGEN